MTNLWFSDFSTNFFEIRASLNILPPSSLDGATFARPHLAYSEEPFQWVVAHPIALFKYVVLYLNLQEAILRCGLYRPTTVCATAALSVAFVLTLEVRIVK